jgi:hypothetical protein
MSELPASITIQKLPAAAVSMDLVLIALALMIEMAAAVSETASTRNLAALDW